MDILLINSIDIVDGNDHPLIGQLILRKILKNKYETEYINFDYLNSTKKLEFDISIKNSIEKFIQHICCYCPKIVGFYTICDSFIITVKIAEGIKKVMPNVKIIFGGPHATLTAENCLKYFDFLDAVSIGESEKTIIPLIDALMDNRSLDGLHGIAYRKNSKIVINKNNVVQNVVSNELSKYTEYDYAPYEIPKEKSLLIEAGRGCPFGCKFCSTSIFFGRKYRIKPIKDLVNEIKQFYIFKGVRKFSLQHDMLTADRVYILKLCDQLIKEDMDISWSCSARIDCLDEELIKVMKKAKCNSIYIGIETGSQHMQHVENKNLNLHNSLDLIKLIRSSGISLTISFIYGFPKETVSDFMDTLDFIHELMLLGIYNVQLHRFVPLPKTEDTEFIKDKLYFNIDQSTDYSIFAKNLLTELELNDYILKMPEVFTQYYTFKTEVRDKYSKIDTFIVMLDMCICLFKKATKELLKNNSLEKLYNRNLKFLDDLYQDSCKLSTTSFANKSCINTLLLEYLIKIIKEECVISDSIIFKEMFRYEFSTYSMKIIAQSKKDDGQLIKDEVYGIDVMEYEKNETYIPIKTIIRFIAYPKRLSINKLKIKEKNNTEEFNVLKGMNV